MTGVTFMIVKMEKYSYEAEDSPKFERKLVFIIVEKFGVNIFLFVHIYRNLCVDSKCQK